MRGSRAAKHWIWLTYAVLLLAHHAVRWIDGPYDPAPRASQRVVQVGDGVEVAYEVRESSGPAVLFLHGVPGDSREFDALLDGATLTYRAITIDLPGFGTSTRGVEDPSASEAARAALAVLDTLGVTQAHLVAHGQGGNVAIEILRARPAAGRSLTLVAASGVEEFELLGNHEINQPLYAAQLAILWLVDNVVPHFGLYDRAPLNLSYARFFHRGDSRSARPLLESLEIPTLIVHGSDDFLVPPEVAAEHARIVPQSRLVMVDDVGHTLIHEAVPRVREVLGTWIEDVEAGRARWRADAELVRATRAAVPIEEIRDFHAHGVTLLLLWILVVFATFVSEDATCIGVGLLIAQGRLGWMEGFSAVFVGIYFGDLILYGVGHALGMTVVKWVPFRWFLSERDLRRGASFFGKRGLIAIFLTRFLPGSRLPTYLAVGVVRAGFWRFAGFFFVAVMAWTPVLVGFAALVGQEALAKFEKLQQESLIVFAVVVAVLFVVLRVLIPLARRRGRRLAVARWTRWRRWEFWPSWVVYLPIVWKAFGWARHYGGLTAPTAANWGMAGAGGMIGESKMQILDAIGPGDHVARSLFVPDGPVADRLASVDGFMRHEGLELPIVLKPDVGQRGEGVHVVRSRARLEELLDEQDVDLVLQEFVSGIEFGISYERGPDESHGRITSIAEKRPLRVTGDGQRNLERLILDDPRAVALAERHLRRHAERLEWVPEAGEVVALVEIGTHAKGAIFLDARDLITPELEDAIDRLSRRFEGFHLGRYDVRVPSRDALRRGQDFVVLELNGLTAEPAHVYDPQGTLRDARAALAAQWEAAYRIGAEQIRRGHAKHTLRSILLAWFRHGQRRRRHAPVKASDPVGPVPRPGQDSTDAR